MKGVVATFMALGRGNCLTQEVSPPRRDDELSQTKSVIFVMLSEAKHLRAHRERCFASLSMTFPVVGGTFHYRAGVGEVSQMRPFPPQAS